MRMINFLAFRLKQNYLVLLPCLFFIFSNQVIGVSLGEEALSFVVIFLIYKFNVEEKVKKNWIYFQSLPFTFLEQTLIRIFLPFLLAFFLLTFIDEGSFSFLEFYISGTIQENFIFASILVTASIFSRSIGSFIGYILLCKMVEFIFDFSDEGWIFLSIVFLGLSISKLSSYRKSVKKNVIIAGCIGIVLMVVLNKLERPIYVKMMTSSNQKIQLVASIEMLSREDSRKARDLLQNRLYQLVTEEVDSRGSIHINKIEIHYSGSAFKKNSVVQKILYAFRDSQLAFSYSVEEWTGLINSAELRNKRSLIKYLRKDHKKYPFLNYKFFSQLEKNVWRADDRCRKSCRELAKLVGKRSDTINWDSIKLLLNSNDYEKVDYALRVIEYSKKIILKSDLIKQMESPSKHIRRSAVEILETWSLNN